jgi:hypothetical protein
MKHVALIKNDSGSYNVLGAMTEALAAAFARMGVRSPVYEVVGEEFGVLAERIRKDLPECTWGINTALDENFLFQSSGVPHVDLSVDSCIRNLPWGLHLPHLVQLFVDEASVDLFSSYGVERVHWFPHAIAQETIDIVRAQPPSPLDTRPYDVALIGSHFPGGEWLERPIDGKRVLRPLRKVIDQALADRSFPFVQEALDGIAQIPELEHVDVIGLLNALEMVLRGVDRERLLHVLRGRSIHIFTGVEDAAEWMREGSAKGCTFHPPVDFHDVIHICCQSKVVINSFPHIRCGYHERLFLSLASGAITLVERGRLPSWLLDVGRVVEYDTSSLQTVPQRLIEAQNRPYDRARVLSWLGSEHTWDARLQQLLPTIEADIAAIREHTHR